MSVLSFAPNSLNSQNREHIFCALENYAYAAALADRVTAVVCDGTNPAAALSAAAKLRRLNLPFYAAPLLADARAVVARRTAAQILQQMHEPDQRRLAFEALAVGALRVDNEPSGTLALYPPVVLKTMRDFMQMGDAVAFRSQTERARVEQLLGVRREWTALAPLERTDLPDIRATHDARRIVVWAPQHDADAMAIYVYALWYLQESALIVCRGALENTPHTFIAPEHGLEALRSAAVLIDTELHDPSTALHFADRGFGLAVAQTSGADEYIDGVISYDPGSFSSIFDAVSQARADRRTRPVTLPTDADILREILAGSSPARTFEETPLVSIIIPTYNRPAYLTKCLRGLMRQTYPNLEVIVVNDGGADVSDIVAQCPFARLITMEQNVGAVHAQNTGMRAARGEYIGTNADDDLVYANHYALLVEALQLSGAQVAHGNCLMHFIVAAPDTSLHTCGYAIHHDTHLDPFATQWSVRHTSHTLLVHRSLYEKTGYYNEAVESVSDHEVVMRFARYSRFVHVGVVTGEGRIRNDGFTRSARDGDKMLKETALLFSTYAPDERPLVQARRQIQFAAMQANQAQTTFCDLPLPLSELEPWNKNEP